MQIDQFICRSDNFAVLIHDEDTGKTVAVDAPNGPAIAERLKRNNWNLTAVLVTHHHDDHTNGLNFLKALTGATIYASERISALTIDHRLQDGARLTIDRFLIEIIATPGHTLDSLSYYWPKQQLVFTGDTLFSLGCGRLFEANAATMLASLKKLRTLPADTALYCGHEYTLANSAFARMIEPQNDALRQRSSNVRTLIENKSFTLPSSMGLEKATNPFLRWDSETIRANLAMIDASDETVFATLRKRKDQF